MTTAGTGDLRASALGAPRPGAPEDGPGRVLFVVPPLVGHVNPTIALGDELAARGHAVAWAGHRSEVADLLPTGAVFHPVAEAMPPDIAEAVVEHTTRSTRGVAALKYFWEIYMLPIARQMAPGIHAAVDSFRPDVLVVDQQTPAGAAVADLRGLPWVTSATTPAELTDTLEGLPKVRDWLRAQMTALLTDVGLDPARAATFDPRLSPHLVLAFTTAALVGDAPLPEHIALVGPSIDDRPEETPFPWEWIDGDGPLVLVTLGTLNWRGGARFFAAAAEALAGTDARAVLVAPDELVPDPPANVLVRDRIPQRALLPHVDAVVTHGGHNTVCETLACGAPMVIAPIRDDQPMIAEQVTRAGAGVRVRFSRVTGTKLREAVETVLTDPAYRHAAVRLQGALTSAGGPPAAADRLEGLLAAGAAAGPARQGDP